MKKRLLILLLVVFIYPNLVYSKILKFECRNVSFDSKEIKDLRFTKYLTDTEQTDKLYLSVDDFEFLRIILIPNNGFLSSFDARVSHKAAKDTSYREYHEFRSNDFLNDVKVPSDYRGGYSIFTEGYTNNYVIFNIKRGVIFRQLPDGDFLAYKCVDEKEKIKLENYGVPRGQPAITNTKLAVLESRNRFIFMLGFFILFGLFGLFVIWEKKKNVKKI